MDIILQEDYPQLGYVGDRVTVKNGFARNFLIPRGIGFEVHSKNARQLEHRLQGVLAKKKRKLGEAEALAEDVKKVALQFTLKMGEKGKSFGSVTVRDIAAEFEKAGQPLDRKQIRLAEPIKSPGTYKIEVKLHADVAIEMEVEVKGEKVARKKTEDKKGKKTAAEEGVEEESFDSEASDEYEDIDSEEASEGSQEQLADGAGQDEETQKNEE